MINISVNKEAFVFTYVPDYAKFLLQNKLYEFVTVAIRFCREVDLPLLKPLSKFSEKELVDLSMDSNSEMLSALAEGRIADLINENTKKWISNTLEVVDKDEIAAEDLTLVFFIRRKTFTFFLDSYTKNVVLQKFIISEIDNYTTQEELISLSVYLEMQREKFANVNERLKHQHELLLEAQLIGETGSYLVDFNEKANSFYSPQYLKIIELDENATFEEFLEHVAVDDREKIITAVENAFQYGGDIELEYKYSINGKKKRIWTRGYVTSKSGKPQILRGTLREIKKNKRSQ